MYDTVIKKALSAIKRHSEWGELLFKLVTVGIYKWKMSEDEIEEWLSNPFI